MPNAESECTPRQQLLEHFLRQLQRWERGMLSAASPVMSAFCPFIIAVLLLKTFNEIAVDALNSPKDQGLFNHWWHIAMKFNLNTVTLPTR